MIRLFQDRLKNKGMWISLLALVGFLLKETVDIDMGTYNTFVELFLAFLVALGVVSDPREGNWYNDDKEEV